MGKVAKFPLFSSFFSIGKALQGGAGSLASGALEDLTGNKKERKKRAARRTRKTEKRIEAQQTLLSGSLRTGRTGSTQTSILGG